MKYDVKLIKQLLLDFYSNQENVKLVDYYTSQTFFDAIKKSRSETVHSAFLAWLLEGKDFPNQGNNSTLMHFLQILLRRYEGITNEMDPQEKAEFDTSLSDALYSGTLNLSNIKVETEKPVSDFLSGADQKDKLDIYISCNTNIPTAADPKFFKTLRIFIENKVGSIENGPKGNKAKYDITINVSSSGADGSSKTKSMEVDAEKYSTIPKTYDNYNLLYQTDRYYCACKSDDSNNIDLFVFLTAISQKELDTFSHLQHGEDLCWCEKYINICYQDILDYVIEPLLDTPNMSDKTIAWLNEYVKCLSIPGAAVDEEGKVRVDDKQIIMAVSDSEKKRVEHFIKENANNKKLLNALIPLYATKDYYSIGDDELYSFEDALKCIFDDTEEEITIKKSSNKFQLTKKESKFNTDVQLKSGYFLNVNCETDVAIEHINNVLEQKGMSKRLSKIQVDEDAKQFLEPFWDRNYSLILSALHILSESNGLYADLYEQFSSRDNTKFSINGAGSYSKMAVVIEYVKYILKNSKHQSDDITKNPDIQKYFINIAEGPSKLDLLITEDKWVEQRNKDEKIKISTGKKMLASDRFKPIELDGKTYYISTQWGGKYNSTEKFHKFPLLWNIILKYNKSWHPGVGAQFVPFIVKPI